MTYSAPSNPSQILSPTKLNRLARTVLQSEIGLVWLSAEVSNFVAASSGHWYFTLKDNRAQVRAAMFKQANRYIKPLPKEGDKVLVRASVGLYEPRGDYQLIVEHLEAEGEGRLKLAFEQLKHKLNAEGLFSLETKRALPNKINTIGVITSSSGAALHDVLSVLARRSPTTKVIVYPSLVQGEQASMALRQALFTANRRKEVDVLLITRGGGSIEDMWCFNDEALARDIASSALTVMSAVGHEIDITISDYVADLRAPTPSAAAELLSTDVSTRLHRITQYIERIAQHMHSNLKHARQKHSSAARNLSLLHPTRQLHQYSQRLDISVARMHRSTQVRLDKSRALLINVKKRLNRIGLAQNISNKERQNAQALVNLQKALNVIVKRKSERLSHAAAQLHAISPLATLARGYSITLQDEVVVSSVNQVDSSKPITTKFVDGELVSMPKAVTKDN